jgi:hypothetical protein
MSSGSPVRIGALCRWAVVTPKAQAQQKVQPLNKEIDAATAAASRAMKCAVEFRAGAVV